MTAPETGPAPEHAPDHLHAAVERARVRQQGWHGHGIAAHLILVGSMGVTILAPIFLGLGLGWLIDRARGGGAAGRLGLLLAGAACGLWCAWRVMDRAHRRHHPDDQEPPP